MNAKETTGPRAGGIYIAPAPGGGRGSDSASGTPETHLARDNWMMNVIKAAKQWTLN